MIDILLVAFGSLLGANTRFLICERFKKINLYYDFSILIVNTFASFLFGLFMSTLTHIETYIFSSKLVLFFFIGFLGSFSTFSTFVYDLFDAVLQLKLFRALKIFFLSVALGVIAIAFGLFLGN